MSSCLGKLEDGVASFMVSTSLAQRNAKVQEDDLEKKYIGSLISFMLAVLIVAQAPSATAYGRHLRRKKEQMDARLESGSEVGARLARLVQGNADVRAALDGLESKRLTPSLKETWSLVVSIPPCGQSRCCESSPYLEAGDWPESIRDGARIELIWCRAIRLQC